MKICLVLTNMDKDYDKIKEIIFIFKNKENPGILCFYGYTRGLIEIHAWG